MQSKVNDVEKRNNIIISRFAPIAVPTMRSVQHCSEALLMAVKNRIPRGMRAGEEANDPGSIRVDPKTLSRGFR